MFTVGNVDRYIDMMHLGKYQPSLEISGSLHVEQSRSLELL